MKGFTFWELLIVVALIGLMILIAVPDLKGMERRREFENFGRETFDLLEKCRWKAMNQRAYSGAFFQVVNGSYYVSGLLDGNQNGIRQADMQTGKDHRWIGPFLWQKAKGDIRPGMLTGIPQIPPKTGVLDTGDPIRFGKSDIISFSPTGDSSSGTLYLVCQSQQQMFAIVIYGPTARMNLWKFSNFEWQMVGDR